MKRLGLLMLILTVALTSCEEPPPPEDLPPPPPTVGEIRGALDSTIQGIRSGNYGQAQKIEALSKMLEIGNKYRTGPNWKEALTGFAGSVSAKTKSVYDTAKTDEDAWPKVRIWCEVLAAVDPDNVKLKLYRQKATAEINKPKVTFKGHMVAAGTDTIFIDIEVPKEGKTYSEKVRVGQEIHGIKIIEMIGAGKGIVIEYLETNDRKEIMR